MLKSGSGTNGTLALPGLKLYRHGITVQARSLSLMAGTDKMIS